MAQAPYFQTTSQQNGILLLPRADIAALMTPADYLIAVSDAFRLSKEDRAIAPPPMHIAGRGGAFHAKGAFLAGERSLVALKLNGNFPRNPDRGLPTIQGLIVLCDADTGVTLAIMDSIEITLRRTAAATTLAAKRLARPDAAALTVIGCGNQANAQAEALSQVFEFEQGFAWDIDEGKAEAYASTMQSRLGFDFKKAPSLHDASRAGDVVVMCTTARAPILCETDLSPGAFVAAVGADNPEKNELHPSLMAKVKVVVDVLDQCLVMGDLHHAVKAGTMTAADVYGDIGDILTDAKPGREQESEIIIFDSTGTAIQDVTSAALVYQRACERGAGGTFSF